MHVTQKVCGEPPRLSIAGQEMKWVKKIKHLGNIVRSDLKEADEICHKKCDLIRRVNHLSVTLGGAPDNVFKVLFNSQCSHLYGCEAWDQQDASTELMYKTWNRGVRKILGLPYRTHTRFLSSLLQTPHIEEQVQKRFYKMMMTMVKGKNCRVSFLIRRMGYDARSISGKNIRCISNKCKLTVNRLLQENCHLQYPSVTPDDERTIAMIMELRDTLKGINYISILEPSDIHILIDYLCCN